MKTFIDQRQLSLPLPVEAVRLTEASTTYTGSIGLYEQQELSKYFLMTTPQQQRRNNHYRKRSWVYRPYKNKKPFEGDPKNASASNCPKAFNGHDLVRVFVWSETYGVKHLHVGYYKDEGTFERDLYRFSQHYANVEFAITVPEIEWECEDYFTDVVNGFGAWYLNNLPYGDLVTCRYLWAGKEAEKLREQNSDAHELVFNTLYEDGVYPGSFMGDGVTKADGYLNSLYRIKFEGGTATKSNNKTLELWEQ